MTAEPRKIMATIERTDTQLRQQYAAIHAHIVQQLPLLKATFAEPGGWWNTCAGLDGAREEFAGFISNIEYNFGAASACCTLPEQGAEHGQRLRQIADAVSGYRDDMDAWQEAMA